MNVGQFLKDIIEEDKSHLDKLEFDRSSLKSRIGARDA
jgi:hypothetical protein